MDTILRLLTHLTNPDVLIEYTQYLLMIILVFSFLEVIIPPIPGDTLLVIGSSIAGIASINPVWIIISSFAGTFTASLFLYSLGNKFEHKLLVSPKYSWLLDTKTFIQIEKWFNRFGYWTLLLSRFLPIARSGVVLAAGIVNFDKRRALIGLSISILLSSTLFVFIGRFLGEHWEKAYLEWGPKVQLFAVVSLGLFALLAIGIGILKLRSRQKNK
ncbi:MAG: DedA family protein [Firmicutes bacterium]|nr:DedA family protein [Bacillota bacterium]